MTEKVVELGPHHRMTPEEASSEIQKVEWDQIICFGYDKDGNLELINSEMTPQDALWLFKQAYDNSF